VNTERGAVGTVGQQPNFVHQRTDDAT
jgi:hypothetical protein